MIGGIVIPLVSGGMALAGVVTGALLNSRLSLSREYRIQCGNFYAAFNEVLDYLKTGNFNDQTIIARSLGRHEEAIGIFKFWLQTSQRDSFTEDCGAYRKARVFAKNQEQMMQITQEQAKELADAIEKLLSYTEDKSPTNRLMDWLF